jgi:hypothetical protein
MAMKVAAIYLTGEVDDLSQMQADRRPLSSRFQSTVSPTMRSRLLVATIYMSR